MLPRVEIESTCQPTVLSGPWREITDTRSPHDSHLIPVLTVSTEHVSRDRNKSAFTLTPNRPIRVSVHVRDGVRDAYAIYCMLRDARHSIDVNVDVTILWRPFCCLLGL